MATLCCAYTLYENRPADRLPTPMMITYLNIYEGLVANGEQMQKWNKINCIPVEVVENIQLMVSAHQINYTSANTILSNKKKIRFQYII